MVFASDDCDLYHQIKAPIGFLCRRGLNLKFFIQLLETLLIWLTKTHNKALYWQRKKKNKKPTQKGQPLLQIHLQHNEGNDQDQNYQKKNGYKTIWLVHEPLNSLHDNPS